MSVENNTEKNDDTAAEKAVVDEDKTTEEPEENKATDWKTLSRKWEARAKANLEKAQKYDELQQQQMSELDKEKAKREAVEKELEQLRIQAIRSEVARVHNVPPALLSGSSEDEIKESAETLLSWRDKQVGAIPKAPSSDGAGKKTPIGDNQITSRDELKNMSPADINAALKEGRLNHLLGAN